MVRFIRYVLLVWMTLVSAGGYGTRHVDEEALINRAVTDLNAASRWVIEEGIPVYSQQGMKVFKRKLRDEWVVGHYGIKPYLEERGYMARFSIKARGINHSIRNLYREQVGDAFYEFWVVNVTALDWAGVDNRAEFFVTKTQEVYGVREILTQSDQFLPSYRIAGGREIVFPVDDLMVLYNMQAWEFPDNYRGVDINAMKVFVDRKGTLKRCGSDIFSYLFYPCR